MKGYIHVYTGNGKGKTTAAIGLVIRAVGAGLKVYMGQFIKSDAYSEHKTFKKYLPFVQVETYGRGCFIQNDPEDIDISLAYEGWERAKEIVNEGKFDIVILDEINIAIYYKMLNKNEVVQCMEHKPEGIELVLTGRYADKDILNAADLVTEMREVKHYYNEGILAREGIEK